MHLFLWEGMEVRDLVPKFLSCWKAITGGKATRQKVSLKPDSYLNAQVMPSLTQVQESKGFMYYRKRTLDQSESSNLVHYSGKKNAHQITNSNKTTNKHQ